MAEIEFFATEEEIVELVRWLLDRRCNFIPDLNYEKSSFERLADLQTIKNLAKSKPQFYVVRDELIESPLELREVNLNKHFFYVDPRTGGPSLLLYWGRQFERRSTHLAGTELSYYPWYENSVSRVRDKPSKAFIEIYTEFTKAARRSRRKIKPGNREFWITPENRGAC